MWLYLSKSKQLINLEQVDSIVAMAVPSSLGRPTESGRVGFSLPEGKEFAYELNVLTPGDAERVVLDIKRALAADMRMYELDL